MILNKFRKLFKDLSLDTKIMIVGDWIKEGQYYGHPFLESANAIAMVYEEPHGLDDDGHVFAYIWHNPDNGEQPVTFKEFRKLFRGLPPDTEVMVVNDWKQTSEAGIPLLSSANSTTFIEHEKEWDGDNDRILYVWNDPEKEYVSQNCGY